MNATHHHLRLLMTLIIVGLGWSAHAQVSREYELKAQALYNFLLFVEWPPESFQTASTPVHICVLGSDPFGATIERAIQGRQVNGRPITVSRTLRTDEIDSCHLIFVSEMDSDRLRQILPTRGTPALTVGDTEESVRKGAIIGFFKDRNRLGFEINPDAATRTGLKISSRLLTLAKVAPSGIAK